jgi:EpsI family protein
LLLLPMAIRPAAAVDTIAATDLPAALGDATRGAINSGWSPVFSNASEDSASFNDAPPAVEVYRAVYAQQDGDHRLLRPGNDFLGAEFQLLEQQRRSVGLADGATLELTEYRGTLRQRPRVVWTWYWVAGTQVPGALEARLADLRGIFRSRRDGVAIAAAADCVPDCAAASARLDAFVARHERALRWP